MAVAKHQMEVDGQQISVFVHTERRRNSRVSIAKKGVIIRIPSWLPNDAQQKQIDTFKNWAFKKFSQKPQLLSRQGKIYESGHSFSIKGRSYFLEINEAPIKSGSAKRVDAVIYIKVGKDLSTDEQQKLIPQLISREVAKVYYHEMYNRLLYWHKLNFDQPLNDFRLKYTSSVWGSCSTKGNINLSTRLLFAPEEVVDYVMVHELCHLVHRNHSQRFWNLVHEIMPEYQQHVHWLKVNGANCDF